MVQPLNALSCRHLGGLIRARLPLLGGAIVLLLAIADSAQAERDRVLSNVASTVPSNVTSTLAQSVPPPPPRPIERDTLTLGSEGEDVREFQAMLALLGYYSGDISGRFDAATAEAARNFQTSAGLRVDAVIGPMTWGRLLPAALDDSGLPSVALDGITMGDGGTQSVPAPQSANPDLPTLELGSEGALVSFLQQRLTQLGYYSGAIDGKFGPVTQASVTEAQINFGLFPNGIVDSSLWPYLIN